MRGNIRARKLSPELTLLSYANTLYSPGAMELKTSDTLLAPLEMDVGAAGAGTLSTLL